MAYLRHSTRHVQATLADVVKDWMDGLGWFGPPVDVPFGTTPAVFQVGRMDEAEVKSVTGNLISVSFGEEPDLTEAELGGGIVTREYVMFVDCLAETEAVSLALAGDVMDRLQGQAPGTSRFTTLHDYTTAPPQPLEGYRFEFIDVARRKPDVGYRQNWHVVLVTAELTHLSWDLPE